MRFVNTNNNFLLLEDGRDEYTLVLKNVSKENPVIINSVKCDNGAVTPEFNGKIGLMPGESTNVTVSATDAKSGKISVEYVETKNISKTLEKSFGVTVLETYSGATAKDGMPEDSENMPFVLRYLFGIMKKIYNLISKVLSL